MLTTKERIIEAALKLFAKKGFQATTIRDIAQEAKINSATLYYYIKNKEDFLAEIIKNALTRIIVNAEKFVSNLETPEEKIACIVQLHVITHGTRSLSSLVTDTEFRSLHGENKQEVRDLRKKYELMWYEIIESGKDQGVFTKVKDSKITTFAILSMCTGVVHWYSSGRLSLLEISEMYADMVLNLLGAQRGGKIIQYKDLVLPDPTKEEYYKPINEN